MEMGGIMVWNVVLSLIIAPAFWWLKNLYEEVKRLQILINRTREDYATKHELRDDMQAVMAALHRLEDKLDKALTR